MPHPEQKGPLQRKEVRNCHSSETRCWLTAPAFGLDCTALSSDKRRANSGEEKPEITWTEYNHREISKPYGLSQENVPLRSKETLPLAPSTLPLLSKSVHLRTEIWGHSQHFLKGYHSVGEGDLQN